MALSTLLAHWKSDPQVGPNLIEWRILPGKQAKFEPFPARIHPALKEALEARGIRSLYTHQADSYRTLKEGKNIVVVTGTASGKTLCYNLPVLDSMVNNNETTALYIFPTKALAQDQYALLKSLATQITASNELSKIPVMKLITSNVQSMTETHLPVYGRRSETRRV